jgi:nitrite reductase/ring-hydroxylating ferredoxin subunit
MQNGVLHAVCATADVAAGAMVAVEIGDLQIAIFHAGGEFFATDNVCSHEYALLTDGLLEDHMVECPLHGACFDVKTGKAQCEPVEIDLRVYQTRLTGDRVEICVAD